MTNVTLKTKSAEPVSIDLKRQLEDYFDRLWPICRSITGLGFRESLAILSEIIPVKKLKYETGKRVFDWIVPKEWNARDAYLIDPNGVKRADFKSNNLHLMGYSTPFFGTLPLSKLQEHLYSIPENPTAVPYLTSYYKERWGFCLPHNELTKLPKGNYKVVVDTELKMGHVVVGEKILAGDTKQEILFSANLCHPSLANNELSGPLVLSFLYKKIASLRKRKYTYRFLILPETIGSICYLSDHHVTLKKNVIAGYVVTCIGDRGKFHYKTSRQLDALPDRAAKVVLRDFGEHKILPFFPHHGSDERQYCSPGINLPIGSLMRSVYAQYREYHTSLDDKQFISFDAMNESIEAYWQIVKCLEANVIWRGTVMNGEPQLGRRQLYSLLGSTTGNQGKMAALMWFLNLADGTNDLIDISNRSGCSIGLMREMAEDLEKAGLIKQVVA